MEVREVDRSDEAVLRRWWEVASTVGALDRPWSWFLPWETARAVFTTPDAAWGRALLGAFDDGRLVAGANLQWPLLDNTHVGHAWPFVPVELRRRGVGSALLEHAVDLLQAHGRRTVLCEVNAPIGTEAPGVPFAERHGFVVASTDGTKLADLAETEPTWAALEQEAARHHGGYRFVTYADVLPDKLVAGYCTLNEAFVSEAPMGELDLEPEVWDEARVREKERVFRATGRHETGTVAVAPDGSVAGFTELLTSDEAPELAMQGATLVAREHRGHRLGLAMKIANHRALRTRFPACARIVTGNADVNAHMNAVNDRLGFQEVEQCVEMQRRL